jgi:hypothetical protein
MINTKLIIVDGMPGSGKSTAAEMISQRLSTLKISNELFLETTKGNPLFINTPAFPSLKDEIEANRFIDVVKDKYSAFMHSQEQGKIFIVESVIFQGIVSVTRFKGIDQNKLLDLVSFLQAILRPLNPSLIYFYQEDVEKHWRWICELRGAKFAKSCGLLSDGDFVRAAKGWSEAQAFSCSIINEWSIPKMTIRNSKYSWNEYEDQIHNFLDIGK